MLNEHLLTIGLVGARGTMFGSMAHSSHCNDEGRIIRALHNILVQLDNLLDTRNYETLSGTSIQANTESIGTYWEVHSGR